MGPLVLDANLLLLLVVGTAGRHYIELHKNLTAYSESDFDLLTGLIGLYSDIVLLPHILAEVSSLARQIKNPARSAIQEKLKLLVQLTNEIPLPSMVGVEREEFQDLGLTDGVILHLCTSSRSGIQFALLTADSDLAVRAEMQGYDVQNFAHWRRHSQ